MKSAEILILFVFKKFNFKNLFTKINKDWSIKISFSILQTNYVLFQQLSLPKQK